jgi:hypothetical protein
MATLTLVVPKEIPASGPLRIIVSVQGNLLHHFDPDLLETLTLEDFRDRDDRLVSRQLARLSLNTCSRADVPLPDVNIKEAFMGHDTSDSWSFIVKVDCSVSSLDSDHGVVYLQSKKELDDEGNVEFVPVVPRTAKAKAKYGQYEVFPVGDEGR